MEIDPLNDGGVPMDADDEKNSMPSFDCPETIDTLSTTDVFDILPEPIRKLVEVEKKQFDDQLKKLEEESQINILICGAAGTGKSSLINALLHCPLLPSGGSIASYSLCPTRIKNVDSAFIAPNTFNLRIIHYTKSEWRSRRQTAAAKLVPIRQDQGDDDLHEDEGDGVISWLKNPQPTDILKAVYQSFSVDDDSDAELPNQKKQKLNKPLEREETLLQGMADGNEFEISGVKELLSKPKQIILGLTQAELVRILPALLLDHCKPEHFTRLEAAKKLFPRRSADAQGLQLTESIVWPADVLNLWPLIKYIEIEGTFSNLPLNVTVIDSPGSQDPNQTECPLQSSLNLLRGQKNMVWYLMPIDRIQSRANMLGSDAQTLIRADLLPNLSIILTKFDELSDPPDESAVKRSVRNYVKSIWNRGGGELSQQTTTLIQNLVICFVSASVHFNNHPLIFDGLDIPTPSKKLWKKTEVSGIHMLWNTLVQETHRCESRSAELRQKFASSVKEKCNELITFLEHGKSDAMPPLDEAKNMLANLEEQIKSKLNQLEEDLKLSALNEVKTAFHSCVPDSREQFKKALTCALAEETKIIHSYSTLSALLNRDGHPFTSGSTQHTFDIAQTCATSFVSAVQLYTRWQQEGQAKYCRAVKEFREQLGNAVEEQLRTIEQSINQICDIQAQDQSTIQLERLCLQLLRQAVFSYRNLTPDLSPAVDMIMRKPDLIRDTQFNSNFYTLWAKVKSEMKIATKQPMRTDKMTHYKEVFKMGFVKQWEELYDSSKEAVERVFCWVMDAVEAQLTNTNEELQKVVSFTDIDMSNLLQLNCEQLRALIQQIDNPFMSELPIDPSTFTTIALGHSQMASINGETIITSPGNDTRPPSMRVFWRGLCAAKQSMAARRGRSTDREPLYDQPASALLAPIHEVIGAVDKRYQCSSAFVVVEAQLRERNGRQDFMYNEDEIEGLGLEVRADMVKALNRSGEQLEMNSEKIAWWRVGRDFDTLRYAIQQRYSNSDESYMKDYGETIADIQQCAISPNASLAVHSMFNTSRVSTANRDTRSRYLRLSAWEWMGDVKYLLPRQTNAQFLHGNPCVSMTSDPIHAFRYATGSKKYMQGTVARDAIELPYYWDAASESYRLPDEVKHTLEGDSSLKGIVIGYVVMFLLPINDQDKLAVKDCNDVVDLNEHKHVSINSRYLSEKEVTFYGCVEQKYKICSWPIVAPDLTQPDNPVLRQFYDIVQRNDPMYKRIEEAVRDMVKQQSQSKIRNVREQFQAATAHKICQDLGSGKVQVKISEQQKAELQAALKRIWQK